MSVYSKQIWSFACQFPWGKIHSTLHQIARTYTLYEIPQMRTAIKIVYDSCKCVYKNKYANTRNNIQQWTTFMLRKFYTVFQQTMKSLLKSTSAPLAVVVYVFTVRDTKCFRGTASANLCLDFRWSTWSSWRIHTESNTFCKSVHGSIAISHFTNSTRYLSIDVFHCTVTTCCW